MEELTANRLKKQAEISLLYRCIYVDFWKIILVNGIFFLKYQESDFFS